MTSLRKLTWTALFIALGVALPMGFHLVGLGKAFLPMHIPVLLAGFLTGAAGGAVVGLTTPILSALLTGMPPLVPPTAQIMVFELGTYGFLSGLLYRHMRLHVYPSLILAMVGGRLVYGLIGYFLLPLVGLEGIPLLYPLTAGALAGLPGLAIQLVFVPSLVYLLERHKLSVADGRL